VSDDKDERGGLYGLLTVVVKYILGPVVAAIISWGFAADRADKNHAKSEVGYKVVAESLNQDVSKQIDDLVKRLDVMERAVAANRSTSAILDDIKHGRSKPPESRAPRRQLVPDSLDRAQGAR
jgi:hypothetical protein